MKNLFTIIYYTSNKEEESFETKTRQKLLDVSGDIPIISVSQKPIDLGENICVGEVGASYHNLYRQIEVGCKASKTPFVIMAEADCLYPPDYFKFIPKDKDTCFMYDKIFILKKWVDAYSGKDFCFGALITGRDNYLKELAYCMQGQPTWSALKIHDPIPLWRKHRWSTFSGIAPVISIKTGNGMNRNTSTKGKNRLVLPYWGHVKKVKRWLF